MIGHAQIEQVSARIEDLVQRVQSISDPLVRANVVALLQSAMELHGQALGRMTQILAKEGDAGSRFLRELSKDELFGGLLSLYDLHPESAEFRVGQVLRDLQEEFLSSGIKVVLQSIERGSVQLRVTGSAGGCASGLAEIESQIRNRIRAAVPELDEVGIERILPPPEPAGKLVQLQLTPATAPVR
jgi:Fe-S cluster biogenesis protein NfuA